MQRISNDKKVRDGDARAAVCNGLIAPITSSQSGERRVTRVMSDPIVNGTGRRYSALWLPFGHEIRSKPIYDITLHIPYVFGSRF